MINNIETIIRDGVAAPSGENCQPWRFKVEGSRLSIFNVPEADMSLYNLKQRGSYIAHGALIENITISAKKYGYDTIVTLFPEGDDIHVADIFFVEGTAEEDPLYLSIRARCTNRKEFSGKKIPSYDKEKLVRSAEIYGTDRFIIVDDDTSVKVLGKALAINEKVLFENKKLHHFFYTHLIWNKKDEKKAGGFFIDTLEFTPPQRVMVKLFKSWRIVSFLNAIIGISSFISRDNGEKYVRSGSFGAVTMEGSSKESYVNTGRSIQRVWLQASALGIAMHPCNGTLYFFRQIEEGGKANFTSYHEEIIRKGYTDIASLFLNTSHNKNISFIFRMGYAEEPSAVAARCEPEIVYVK